MLMVAKENPTLITFLSDDPDVFVLLLHCYLDDDPKLTMSMASPIKDQVVGDISKTVEKQKRHNTRNPCCHAGSGCNTVACCFGIRKKTPESYKKLMHHWQL